MGQCRRRRSQQSSRVPSPSKVTTSVNRSSDVKLIACDRPHRGSNQTAKHEFLKSESVSRSYECDKIEGKHRIASESGQRNSKRPAGTPMMGLLADEMSKETEYTQQVPGVIAKLMGLDAMPSQLSFHKQHKISSDGFHQKTVSSGSLRHRIAFNNQSCKKTSKEQYKDVYEVRECSRARPGGCKPQLSPNMMHAEDEMKFHGETDFSDSNSYLLERYLQEPDSLLAKHLHNLHAAQESRCEHVRKLKLSNTLDNNINAIGHLTDMDTSDKIDISMSHEYQAGPRHASRNQAKCLDLSKSATLCAEADELASDVPTKIVLLKPKLEGSRKSAKFCSSSTSCCELLSDGETHKYGGRRQAEICGKNRLPIGLDISAHKCQESKELAKEITRQMRNRLGDFSVKVPLSGCRRYSADESSHEVSGNDSSYESYATFPTSQTCRHPSFHRKSSSSHYAKSSVNKEAKKRLSERWKMSHRSEEFSFGAKGSTLGEMLAIYDTDMRLPKLDGEMAQDRSSSSFNGNRKLSGKVEPFGISSKDGWRTGCLGTLSRSSESLQTAYDHFGNPETCIKYEARGTERFLIPKEGSRNGRNKGVNREFSWNEGSSTGMVRLQDKRVDAPRSQVGRKGKKSIVEAKNSSVQEPVILDSPTCRLDTMLTLDSDTVREHMSIHGSVGSGDEVIPATECSSLRVRSDSSSSQLPLSEITQEPLKTCRIDSSPYRGAQPESPASNKEADHPSPVSVLDTPFVEYHSSGSECFGRVSAELHGLRMQLHLLKLETGASILVSSDDEEQSPASLEGAKHSTCTDNWEASFIADMLAEFEFNCPIPDTFMDMLHSPECPVGLHVFPKLEKKYTYPLATCSRSDKRLLFDAVNSCILEISQRFITDPVKPSKDWFEAELHKLLEVTRKQEKDDVADIGMAFLRSKTQWMNLGNYIEEIGCEMAKMLLDELVYEALAM